MNLNTGPVNDLTTSRFTTDLTTRPMVSSTNPPGINLQFIPKGIN